MMGGKAGALVSLPRSREAMDKQDYHSAFCGTEFSRGNKQFCNQESTLQFSVQQ